MDISADAIPPDSVADYLLEPAEPPEEEKEQDKGPDNETEGATRKEGKSQKSSLVIFAVDVSGSMSTTAEVPALQGMCV